MFQMFYRLKVYRNYQCKFVIGALLASGFGLFIPENTRSAGVGLPESLYERSDLQRIVGCLLDGNTT